VLVGSEATRRTVQRSAPWLAPGRLILLPKGIDTARFRPAEPPAGARPPVVGYVGQLIARKGLAALMDAWELVLARRAPRAPRPRLRLAGAGPWRDRLVAWREGLPDPGTVELVGFLEDVPGFWAGCRVGVLPSRAEGYGLAAAEASACGVPVVGADASSLPEVVADGETGLLVPADHPAALAAALGRLLRDDALATRMGAAGRRRAETVLDAERCWDRLLAVTCPEDSP
jgi:glycosyltransferase involved in cell wall biosynthesis